MWEIFLLIWLLQKFFSIFNDYYVAVIYRKNIAFIAFWRYKYTKNIKVEVFEIIKGIGTQAKEWVEREMKWVVTLFLLLCFVVVKIQWIHTLSEH